MRIACVDIKTTVKKELAAAAEAMKKTAELERATLKLTVQGRAYTEENYSPEGAE